MALMAVGANAQETITLKGGWNTTTLPAKGMVFTVSPWAEVGFTLDAAAAAGDYAKVGVVLSEGSSVVGFQWKSYDSANANTYSGAYAAGDEAPYTFDISAVALAKVALMLDGNSNSAAKDIQIDHFYLEKADGTQTEFLASAVSNWGVSPSMPAGVMPSIRFDGQYGGCEILDANGASAVYTPGESTAYDYVLEFEAPTTNTLMIEFDNGGSGYKWINFEAGVTKIEFTVNEETSVKNTGTSEEPVMTATKAEQIWLKADAATGYPFTINLKSMNRTASTSNVNAIKTATRDSGVRYNLAGQKVDASYKGVVIENGRKLIQK